MKEKKKEVARQLIEINTLKKKKEKEGTLEIMKNLNKKKVKLQEVKSKLYDTFKVLEEKVNVVEETLKKVEDEKIISRRVRKN